MCLLVIKLRCAVVCILAKGPRCAIVCTVNIYKVIYVLDCIFVRKKSCFSKKNNQATKMVPAIRHLHYEDRLKKLGILTLLWVVLLHLVVSQAITGCLLSQTVAMVQADVKSQLAWNIRHCR